MQNFQYLNDELHCESVPASSLACNYSTPLYVYSAAHITSQYNSLSTALSSLSHSINYAVKANSNLAVLDILAREGAGFDVVSAGEIFRVLNAGGSAKKCTFAGVGKTKREIQYALENDVNTFIVESAHELAVIRDVTNGLGRDAKIAIRINPNVQGGAHEYISTGKEENKFGVDVETAMRMYAEAEEMENLAIVGVHMHIGSQITEPSVFANAILKVAPVVERLKELYAIEFFSIGGGLGVAESSQIAHWGVLKQSQGILVQEYAAAIVPILKSLSLHIVIEPGRFLVANAGILISTVQHVKMTPSGKKFVILDAGMNDLLRPPLYQAYHEILPLRQPVLNCSTETVDIVGPVCESGDFFAKDRLMPVLRPGDIVAIMSAGAYGFSMASTYNSRPLLAEVMVWQGKLQIVRKRQELRDLIRGEYSIFER